MKNKIKSIDIKDLFDYVSNLQEENKRLELELSGYRTAILNDDKLLGLQERINRAIAYIEAGKTFDNEEAANSVAYIQNHLLKILKGE